MAKLGKRNALLTNYAVREESPFYRCSYRSDYPCDKPPATKISALSGEPVLPPVTPWPAGLPRMCIAFSGGGSRSAAFSIGVMQALAISNQLDRIDVASGVSGGSYALSWLLVTKVNEQEMAEQAIDSTTLLADDAPPIQSLAPRSTLISLPYGIIAVPATLLDKAIKTVLGSEGSASNSYWAALDATFLAGDCEKCLIDGRFLVRDLAPLVLRDQLPFPIIGLSARTEEQGVCDQPGVKRKSLEETFFEVTPLRQGVMNHYSDTGLDLGLADAVALSGAAISVPAASYCEITRVLGLGLGTWKSYTSASHIPAESSSKTNSSDWQSSLEETRLFLADGGHVENLGAFPLIQRLCQSIIVVDAEEDPELEFEALTKLTAFLAARSLKWSVPLHNTKGQSPNDFYVKGHYVGDQVSDPIFRGRIGPIPYLHLVQDHNWPDYRLSNLHLDVHYLKLSFDRELVDSSDCDAYHKANAFDKEQYCIAKRRSDEHGITLECSGSKLRSCPFPHYPTTRQNLSPNEFTALRVLGKRLGKQLVKIPLRPL